MMINYLSEPIGEYSKALTEAESLEALRAVTARYRRVAADADGIVSAWKDDDFSDWRRALKTERAGKFMGESAAARFAAVLMPLVMFQVGLVAEEFKVPFGLAFYRLKDAGRIVESGGIAAWR